MLTKAQDVSLLLGWISFGYSAWSYLPQLILNSTRLPRQQPFASKGGLPFEMLWIWLLGDICGLAGIILLKGLFTQYISTALFAIADVSVMIQQAYFFGHLPGTKRYRARSRVEGNVYARKWAQLRAKPYSPAIFDSAGKALLPTSSPESLPVKPTSPLKSWHQIISASLAKVISEGPWVGHEHLVSHAWQAFVMLLFVPGLFTAIWWKVDHVNLMTKTTIPMTFPHDAFTWAGWILGWGALVTYNYPRVRLLYSVFKSKEVDDLAFWTFAALFLQNVTQISSIILVSQLPSYLQAQTPWLVGTSTPMVLELAMGMLFYLYGGKSKHNKETTNLGTEAAEDEADEKSDKHFRQDLEALHHQWKLEDSASDSLDTDDERLIPHFASQRHKRALLERERHAQLRSVLNAHGRLDLTAKLGLDKEGKSGRESVEVRASSSQSSSQSENDIRHGTEKPLASPQVHGRASVRSNRHRPTKKDSSSSDDRWALISSEEDSSDTSSTLNNRPPRPTRVSSSRRDSVAAKPWLRSKAKP